MFNLNLLSSVEFPDCLLIDDIGSLESMSRDVDGRARFDFGVDVALGSSNCSLIIETRSGGGGRKAPSEKYLHKHNFLNCINSFNTF